MATISINTHKTTHSSHPVPSEPNRALKVLVVGEFGGEELNTSDTGLSKLMRIDKDSFDEVFARMKVSLQVPALDQSLAFDELDQMSPDYLYENLEVFAQFRRLSRRLKSPQHFASAVEELSTSGIVDAKTDNDNAQSESDKDTGGLLESLLSAEPSAATKISAETFSAADLIKEVVAPYVEAKTDPKLDHYLAAVDAAAATVLKTILNSPSFKVIERNWRALDLLNRRLDTDNDCHIFMCDCDFTGSDYLSTDAQAIEQSPAYQSWISAHTAQGDQGFDVIVLADTLSPSAAEFNKFAYLAAVASQAKVPLLVGLNPADLSPNFAEQRLDDFDGQARCEFLDKLRERGAQAQVYMAVNRFLTRLPYGAKTRPLETIELEEVESPEQHESYLWSSGAYLLLWGLVNAQRQEQVSYIENLILHVTSDEYGDEVVTPPAEFYITDRCLAEMGKAGLTALQSMRNSSDVIIDPWFEFNSKTRSARGSTA